MKTWRCTWIDDDDVTYTATVRAETAEGAMAQWLTKCWATVPEIPPTTAEWFERAAIAMDDESVVIELED
jgi:hypothetical protein